MRFRQFSSVVFLFIIIIIGNTVIRAQSETLATVGSVTYTANDLPRNARAAYDSSKTAAAEIRTQELEFAIADMLVEEEAKTRKLTVEQLINAEVTKRVPDPTDAQIKALYDANAAQIGNRTLAEVRPQIVAFMRQGDEQKALKEFVDGLRKKIKVTNGINVNSATLKPADVIVTVGVQKITAADFNERVKPDIFNQALQNYYQVVSGLEDVIYSGLILTEARSLKIEPEELIAREITNKMSNYSDAESHRLESDLRSRLFKKHNVKILLPEPEAPLQKISVDDDPSFGNAKAPVTIVMFSDFQCSACAAAHPLLKDVMKPYGDKVRLVVRDFPLVEIHQNAFKAAQAAGAANAQGKFFEYIELLYKNQNAQDDASLKAYATQLGLDRAKFDAELDKNAYTNEITKDLQDGESYGIRGTPTLFINGRRVAINSAEHIKKMIDKALTQKP